MTHKDKQSSSAVSRRDFAKAGAAAAGLVLVKPGSVYGAPANSRLNLGLIGAGGRGSHDAGVFIRSTNTQMVAVADAFQDRLDAAKTKFDDINEGRGFPKVDRKRLYLGMDAYQDLLASGVDVVVVTSPPYYHPLHIEAAVDAGVSVYSEKPVATDVVGAKRVIEAGKKAEGKVGIQSGTQLRSSAAFAEAVKRVHRGDIGEIVSGQVYYHAGALGDRSKGGETKDQKRLRNWVFDIALSGDIIVEQNIHVLDVCNWHLDSHPIKAIGTGGQKARTGLGDCYDHFQVLYTYPNDVQIAFTSTQFLKGWNECSVRLYGTKGVVVTDYGKAQIMGDNPWKSDQNPFDGAETTRTSEFVQSILDGKPINDAKHGAEGALTSILGREATYKGRELTWRKMVRSNQKFRVKIDA